MPRRLICVLLLTWLSSCAWLTTDNSEKTDYLPLAPPLAPSRRIVQEVEAEWGNHQDTFLCVLELDKNHIAIAGLTKDGMSLFNLSYNGKDLVMDKSRVLPVYVEPEHIIKDFQLVFWPIAQLSKLLSPPMRLEGNQFHRNLYFNGDLRVNVDYIQPDKAWAKSVILTNYRHHYRLKIKTLSYEVLPE